ncbi:NAD(P)-dependent oxidoreductase [Flavobacterium sp. ANB]|uniref:NAD-dependent epimerase/dehydratase family protein n=1 Tax=unclassified Flavobacterium TaxID=196869 RepID=UPI0012B74204|nr:MULTISPECIES: NAD(P)-dependent oxidoreductase [unclassified Flavobacterium]MBF4517597.1 NAD(P)-dependent oxidoreductase [Flavobacterium sp. ANB]MTD70324.1 NAD-dependent epimerase/dehydratase family protein [Flavobacterium sp. LC2016-13]
MKILITGIYGFLGTHLANKLAENHTVFGLYNTEKDVVFKKNITCFNQLDLVDIVPDVIIMCHAAVSSGTTNINKSALIETNVNFTKKIVKKFATIKSIYVSSVSIFGNQKEVVNEQSIHNPETDYALSKLFGENEVSQNPDSVIIRFSSLYGNGMKENTLIPNYCNQALEHKTIQVWGNGSRFQNYIHISDAVRLIEKTIDYKSKISFPVLGVSSKEYSNDEVAKIISKQTNSAIDYINQDNSPSFHYNNKMTQKTLDWQPEIELEKGLKQYLEWKKK